MVWVVAWESTSDNIFSSAKLSGVETADCVVDEIAGYFAGAVVGRCQFHIIVLMTKSFV